MDYKKRIIDLLDEITNESMLRRIYLMLTVMVRK